MRTCTVCRHPKRGEIDAALVSQVPIRDVSGQFAVTRSALDRHRKHLAPALLEAQGAKEEASAENLLDTVRGLAADAHRIRARAEKANDLRTALDAIGKLTKIVELLARLRASDAAGEAASEAASAGAIPHGPAKATRVVFEYVNDWRGVEAAPSKETPK